MTDENCPNCGVILDFKNMIRFDDKKLRLISITYDIECLDCGMIFTTLPRESKKASNEDLTKIEEDIGKMTKRGMKWNKKKT